MTIFNQQKHFLKLERTTIFCYILKKIQGRYHASVEGSALFVLVRVVTKTGEQARDFNYPGLTVLDGYKWNNNDPTTLNYGRMSVLYTRYSILFIRFNLLFLNRERWIRF